MKWHCIITNTAVCLNELGRKRTAYLLCLLIIWYQRSIVVDSKKRIEVDQGDEKGEMNERDWKATITQSMVMYMNTHTHTCERVCMCVWCPLTRESLGSACLALLLLQALEMPGCMARWLTQPAKKSSQGLTHTHFLVAKLSHTPTCTHTCCYVPKCIFANKHINTYSQWDLSRCVYNLICTQLICTDSYTNLESLVCFTYIITSPHKSVSQHFSLIK